MEKMLLLKKATANQVITQIWNDDIKILTHDELIDVGYKYYLFMNKLFSPMEKDGYLSCCGEEMGESGKFEKIWEIKNEKI
jgi:hypothetical protein